MTPQALSSSLTAGCFEWIVLIVYVLISIRILNDCQKKGIFFRSKEVIWDLINILGTSRVKSLFENSTLFCFVTPQWNFINLDTDSAKVMLVTFMKKEFAEQSNAVCKVAGGFCILIGGEGAGFMHRGITF